MGSFAGDPANIMKLIAYCVADFAGDARNSKSISGGHIAFVGPNTSVQLTCVRKRQTVVSHCGAESGIVSLEVNLRTEAVPILSLWGLVVAVMHPGWGNGGKLPLGGELHRRD